jgi:preprotein translocase subunit SecG
MSGRGAADALAKMTSVAGGFFIVTSLGLTLISGAASTSGRSVMDLVPSISGPATTTPPATTEEPTAPQPTAPDPTEGRAPATNQFTLGPGNAAASTPTNAQRAGPIETQTASVTPQRQPPNTGATQRNTVAANTAPTTQRATAQPTTQRTVPATTPATTTAQRTTAPATQPANTAVTGIDLTTDNQLGAESTDSGNGVTTVRRERAGPDQ